MRRIDSSGENMNLQTTEDAGRIPRDYPEPENEAPPNPVRYSGRQTDLDKWLIFGSVDADFLSTLRTVLVFGERHSRAPPVPLPDSRSSRVSRIGITGSEAILVTREGDVFGLGANSSGVLGIGTEDSTLVPRRIEILSRRGVTSIAAGDIHVLACTREGDLYSWGDNTHGQLGTGAVGPCLDPTPVGGSLTGKTVTKVACGAFHSLCLTADGEVGRRLGPPAVADVRLVLEWGQNVRGRGVAGEPQTLPKPQGTRAVAVACGRDFSVFLLDSGKKLELMVGREQTLGPERGPTRRGSPLGPERGPTRRGSPLGPERGPTRRGSPLGPERGPTRRGSPLEGVWSLPVQRGKLGRSWRTAPWGISIEQPRDSGGIRVYSWGANGSGQLGLNHTHDQPLPCVVDINLRYVFVSQVACGYAHVLALSDEGHLYVWGANECGQLGLGDRNVRPVPTRHPREIGRVVEIGATHYSRLSGAMTRDARVYAWGQFRDMAVAAPFPTQFHSVDDAFASFSSPSVACGPISVDARPGSYVLDSLRAAFDNPERSDVRILVEGRTIHVHRSVLEIRCGYFRTLFIARNALNNEIEMRPAFPFEVYHAFLRFLYTGELGPDIEIAIGMLEVATEYGEPELMQECGKVIARGITVENAGRLYAVAVRCGPESLEDFCFRFCLNHLTRVVTTEAFRELDDGVSRAFFEKAARYGAFRY
ncbi:unnamed protein product [Darwinula stevensoni]|uniref:BTB domain-containing protein n=1 Tax=Darwinula stevensoni TaxID=69355 RepID=A0A7R9AC84_9CRUS|nr:unnamed protein product [Darwinula stevensoni]CAG0899568.1 unnamed protein product [Darwinula stevensoni]